MKRKLTNTTVRSLIFLLKESMGLPSIEDAEYINQWYSTLLTKLKDDLLQKTETIIR